MKHPTAEGVAGADPGTTRVRVDEASLLARWADRQALGRRRPLAAIGAAGRRPTLFVADEVLVDADDPDLVEDLVRRHGGAVLPPLPVPPPPPGMDRAAGVSPAVIPLPVRVRFADAPRVEGAADRLTDHARQGRELRGAVTVTSERAARVAALVSEHAAAGRPVGLNVVGHLDALPLTSAQEWAGHPGGSSDPFAWLAFSGRSRITSAWQLVESYRQIRSLPESLVWVGVLDSGFWLDGAGRPFVPAGQAVSDLGGGVVQVNLLDESASAGGPSGLECGTGYHCPWHGNGVASAAVATVGNLAGAAGAGGTVARPALFKTDLSCDQIFRCLQLCLAWGVDVLNMSFSLERWELIFPTGSWDKAFGFASDNGLVLVAAAGNDDEELPGLNVRPATRTPGVITVGALDVDAASEDYTRKADFSNYGASLSVWSPGVAIPVAPDDLQPDGSVISGTSVASPLVAGVAALLRAVDPSLSSVRVRQILAETGWQGTDGVGPCLDAYAAVFRAIGSRLPDHAEPNDTAPQARPLLPAGPGGSLVPGIGGFTSRSHGGDEDWWRFDNGGFSKVTITAEWYQRLSNFGIELRADDPESRGPDELVQTGSVAEGTRVLTGLLPPGAYRLRVIGSGATAYRLGVRLAPAPLAPDAFEPNDHFEAASRMRFEPRRNPFLDVITLGGEWGPGVFDATLHTTLSFLTGKTVVNPDYYRLEVPESSVFRIPTVRLSGTDAPVDVTLYDAARRVVRRWPQTRGVDIAPPPKTVCFLEVSGAAPTRYRLDLRLKVDKDALPGPLQEEVVVLPPWWGDPRLELRDRVQHYLIDVKALDAEQGGRIVFEQPAESVRLDLLDAAGNLVRQGTGAAADGRPEMSTGGVDPGAYVLRVSRETDAAAAAARLPLLQLRLAPPI